MDDAPRQVIDAIATTSEDLRLLLHPYLRWTLADGRTLHGRSKVLRHLTDTDGDPPPSPASYELRDGQIYRWVEPPAPG